MPICPFFEIYRLPTCPLQCKSPSPQWTPTTTKGAVSHLEFWVNFGDHDSDGDLPYSPTQWTADQGGELLELKSTSAAYKLYRFISRPIMKYGNIWINNRRKKFEVLLWGEQMYTQIQDKGDRGWIGLRAIGRWENTCGRRALYDGTSVRAPPETREPKRQKISTDL